MIKPPFSNNSCMNIFHLSVCSCVMSVCMCVCWDHLGPLSDKGQRGSWKCWKGQQGAEKGETGRGLWWYLHSGNRWSRRNDEQGLFLQMREQGGRGGARSLHDHTQWYAQIVTHYSLSVIKTLNVKTWRPTVPKKIISLTAFMLIACKIISCWKMLRLVPKVCIENNA